MATNREKKKKKKRARWEKTQKQHNEELQDDKNVEAQPAHYQALLHHLPIASMPTSPPSGTNPSQQAMKTEKKSKRKNKKKEKNLSVEEKESPPTLFKDIMSSLPICSITSSVKGDDGSQKTMKKKRKKQDDSSTTNCLPVSNMIMPSTALPIQCEQTSSTNLRKSKKKWKRKHLRREPPSLSDVMMTLPIRGIPTTTLLTGAETSESNNVKLRLPQEKELPTIDTSNDLNLQLEDHEQKKMRKTWKRQRKEGSQIFSNHGTDPSLDVDEQKETNNEQSLNDTSGDYESLKMNLPLCAVSIQKSGIEQAMSKPDSQRETEKMLTKADFAIERKLKKMMKFRSLNIREDFEAFEKDLKAILDEVSETFMEKDMGVIIQICTKIEGNDNHRGCVRAIHEVKSRIGVNIRAYTTTISKLVRKDEWKTALSLFQEIEDSGLTPTTHAYNALIIALVKGVQWEKALDLFHEMKYKKLPITVFSYAAAISACDRGFQWKQCLDYLDEMTDINLERNEYVYGAAISCMEKCCRADLALGILDLMKKEKRVKANDYHYNTLIRACARCNMKDKAWELFLEMDKLNIPKDEITYNNVLDAIADDLELARSTFHEAYNSGFEGYKNIVSSSESYFETDLHSLSLGSGMTTALWWLQDYIPSLLKKDPTLFRTMKTMMIITGKGLSRNKDKRYYGDDTMRDRVFSVIEAMGLKIKEQNNFGRVEIDVPSYITKLRKSDGMIMLSDSKKSILEQPRGKDKAAEIERVVQIVRPREGTARKPSFFLHDEYNVKEVILHTLSPLVLERMQLVLDDMQVDEPEKISLLELSHLNHNLLMDVKDAAENAFNDVTRNHNLLMNVKDAGEEVFNSMTRSHDEGRSSIMNSRIADAPNKDKPTVRTSHDIDSIPIIACAKKRQRTRKA